MFTCASQASTDESEHPRNRDREPLQLLIPRNATPRTHTSSIVYEGHKGAQGCRDLSFASWPEENLFPLQVLARSIRGFGCMPVRSRRSFGVAVFCGAASSERKNCNSKWYRCSNNCLLFHVIITTLLCVNYVHGRQDFVLNDDVHLHTSEEQNVHT